MDQDYEMEYQNGEVTVSDIEVKKTDVPCPCNLALSRQLSNSAVITWDGPASASASGVRSYQVNVDGVHKITVKHDERTKAILEDIDQTQLHRISVQTVTSMGKSNPASCMLVIGNDADLTPGSLKVVDGKYTAATVSWLPSDSTYEHIVSVNDQDLFIAKPGVYQAALANLTPGQSICVGVRPNLSDEGYMQPATMDFRPRIANIPAAPGDVQVEPGLKEGTLLVTWAPVKTDADGKANGEKLKAYAVYADGQLVQEVTNLKSDHINLHGSAFKSFHVLPSLITMRTLTHEFESQDSEGVEVTEALVEEIKKGLEQKPKINVKHSTRARTKMFIGNLTPIATEPGLKRLFEKYGEVLECTILGKYGFIHMYSEDAKVAQKKLHGHRYNEINLRVDVSEEMGGDVFVKMFVGNLHASANKDELVALFEEYGEVKDPALLGKYGFLYINGKKNAVAAQKALNGTLFCKNRLDVDISIDGDRKTRENHGEARDKSIYKDPNAVKLFLGGLNETTDEDELREMFEKYGEVRECSVIKNFGFIHMMGQDNAKKAVKELNGAEVAGNTIQVSISRTKHQVETPTKVFIGNLGEGTTEEDLRELFEEFGEVTSTAMKNNYGFVHMACRNEAERAIWALKDTILNGRAIIPDFSDKDGSYGGYAPPVRKTTKIFVSGKFSTAGTTEDDLRPLFEHFGDVTECSILKDFGFVHMKDPREAQRAVQALENKEVNGEKLHVAFSHDRKRGEDFEYGGRRPSAYGDDPYYSGKRFRGDDGYAYHSGYGGSYSSYPPRRRGYGRPDPYDREPGYKRSSHW